MLSQRVPVISADSTAQSKLVSADWIAVRMTLRGSAAWVDVSAAKPPSSNSQTMLRVITAVQDTPVLNTPVQNTSVQNPANALLSGHRAAWGDRGVMQHHAPADRG